MRKTIHKGFWAWNFDREEAWLNEMAAKGLALVSVGFCTYTFEECTPGEYNVRLELLENLPSHPESQQYLRFLEETGAEYVGSVFRWVYVRKKTDEGEFDLYSDAPSRIRHLNRLLTLLGVLILVNLSIGLSNLSIHFVGELGANQVMGLLNLGLALFLALGCFQVFRKKQALKKQQTLFE